MTVATFLAQVKGELNGSSQSNVAQEILTRCVIRSNVLGDLLKRFRRAYSEKGEEI